MRKGTPKHAVSVKCYTHGCAQLKIAKSLPLNAMERIMEWLYEGRRQHPARSACPDHTRMFWDSRILSGCTSAFFTLCVIHDCTLDDSDFDLADDAARLILTGRK